VLRGADAFDLLPSIAGLVICGLAIMALSVLRFQKRLS
jgi:hypothetical protein